MTFSANVKGQIKPADLLPKTTARSHLSADSFDACNKVFVLYSKFLRNSQQRQVYVPLRRHTSSSQQQQQSRSSFSSISRQSSGSSYVPHQINLKILQRALLSACPTADSSVFELICQCLQLLDQSKAQTLKQALTQCQNLWARSQKLEWYCRERLRRGYFCRWIRAYIHQSH